jgi:hypothetical protein
MADVVACKILVDFRAPDESSARVMYGVPHDVPYLGVWVKPFPRCRIHLFSTSPPEVFVGWGWMREDVWTQEEIDAACARARDRAARFARWVD